MARVAPKLLAFGGMQQRLPATALRPQQDGSVATRELLNLRPDALPVLVPRKVLRFVLEQASAETTFPYRKSAG